MPPSSGLGLGSAMAQGAALGAGAGMGSAAVHSMLGHGRGSSYQSGENVQQQYQQQAQPRQVPCEGEFRQFLTCANNSSDLSMCTAFNDILKNCKKEYMAGTNGM